MNSVSSASYLKTNLVRKAKFFRELSDRYRGSVLALGALLFIVGLWWSISSLELTFSGLNWSVLPIAGFLTVISVLINALEQWLGARALSLDYKYSRALAVSSWATLANILPFPAGVILRGASFGLAGASKRDAATIVLGGAMIWVLLSAALVAAALGTSIGSTVAALSAVVLALAATGWLMLRYRATSCFALFLVRALLIATTVARLALFLDFIGSEAGWREAAIYASASVVGQVVGIVPAGIGLVEGFGAALAAAIGAAPAAAFICLSLNRIAGLSAAGLLVLLTKPMPINATNDRSDN